MIDLEEELSQKEAFHVFQAPALLPWNLRWSAGTADAGSPITDFHGTTENRLLVHQVTFECRIRQNEMGFDEKGEKICLLGGSPNVLR